jgi:hypothetical protein
MNLFSFVIRRATRHWQILLTLSLGVLLSTALLATTPLLVNTVVEFGLRRTLLSADPLAGNLRLKAFGKVGVSEYQALNEEIRALLAARLGRQVNQVIPSAGARWLFPWLDEQPIPTSPPPQPATPNLTPNQLPGGLSKCINRACCKTNRPPPH